MLNYINLKIEATNTSKNITKENCNKQDTQKIDSISDFHNIESPNCSTADSVTSIDNLDGFDILDHQIDKSLEKEKIKAYIKKIIIQKAKQEFNDSINIDKHAKDFVYKLINEKEEKYIHEYMKNHIEYINQCAMKIIDLLNSDNQQIRQIQSDQISKIYHNNQENSKEYLNNLEKQEEVTNIIWKYTIDFQNLVQGRLLDYEKMIDLPNITKNKYIEPSDCIKFKTLLEYYKKNTRFEPTGKKNYLDKPNRYLLNYNNLHKCAKSLMFYMFKNLASDTVDKKQLELIISKYINSLYNMQEGLKPKYKELNSSAFWFIVNENVLEIVNTFYEYRSAIKTLIKKFEPSFDSSQTNNK